MRSSGGGEKGQTTLHGSTDKEDTDKKSGEAQASIKMCVCVCVWAASSHTQASKGVREALVCSVMS